MNGASRDSSTAGNFELETINVKLRAIHRIRGIIFRKKKGSWKLEDLCSILTRQGAYESAWLALTGPKGTVKEFAESGLKKILADRYYACVPPDSDRFSPALKAFLKRTDYAAVNADPLIQASDLYDFKVPPGLIIITLRIGHKSKVYGALSVAFRTGLFPIEDETLLLYEAANDIAFALYDMQTESKQLQMREIINSLEARHRTVFENTGNATCVFEENTIISLANSDFERLSGYSKEEIEGRMSWTEFIAQDDLNKMTEYHRLRRIDPRAAPRNYYFQFIDRTGNLNDIYMTIALIPNTKKSIASFMDITEQKRLEKEVLKISEKERREIGNNLHDGLGPHLVGIKFLLNLLKKKLADRGIPEFADIDEIGSLIDQAVSQTRLLVKGLCPVDIDSEGLAFALEELTSNVEKLYGIQCTLVFDETVVIEDNTAATQLFYIAREAVNNAIKHSKAANIEVSFHKHDSSLLLAVKDDGIGIEMLDNTGGMGINIMKYRARLINALLDVIRNDEGGTSVICIIR